MEAIVLAGGLGTRLRAVVPDLPKAMAPVAGRPFLEILLAALARKGIARVVLSLGYMAETISAHFGNTFAGMDLVHEVEPSPLGTGGAVRLASRHCAGSHYYVFNGDSFLDLELGAVEARWQSDRRPMIVARSVPDTARYGRLETQGQRIVGFMPKGVTGPGLINGGCYVFGREELASWPEGHPFSMEMDHFPEQVKAGRYDFFLTQGHFIDIGVPADYARAQTELADVCR